MSGSEPRYLLAPSGILTPELRGRLHSFGPLLEVESVADLVRDLVAELTPIRSPTK